jgi:hypothetical protein
MTIFEDMEKWASLLPPANTRIPTVLKVKLPTYNLMLQQATPSQFTYKGPARYDSVQCVIDNDIDANWIMYDQHGEEMKRSE